MGFPRCRYIFRHVFRPLLYSNIDHFVRFFRIFEADFWDFAKSSRPTLHLPPLKIGQNCIFPLKKICLQHVDGSSGPQSFDVRFPALPLHLDLFVIAAYCHAADDCAGIPTAFSGARTGPTPPYESNPHIGSYPPKFFVRYPPPHV